MAGKGIEQGVPACSLRQKFKSLASPCIGAKVGFESGTWRPSECEAFTRRRGRVTPHTNLRPTKNAMCDWFPPEEKELAGSLALSPSLVRSNLMVLFRFLQKGSCGASQEPGSGPLFARELAGAECYKTVFLAMRCSGPCAESA